MKGMTQLALDRPVALRIFALTLLLLGILAGISLDKRALPEITTTRLTVTTIFPGLPGDQIRTLVTLPLEKALGSVAGLKTMTSKSCESLSSILLDLHWGTDPQKAQNEACQILDRAIADLPEGASVPQLSRSVPGVDFTAVLVVRPESGDLAYGKTLAKTELKTRIQEIPGIEAVKALGGQEREFEILLNPERLKQTGLSLEEVARWGGQQNRSVPLGMIRTPETVTAVNYRGQIRSVEEWKHLPIPLSRGSVLPLGKLATVGLSNRPGASLFLHRGTEATALFITASPGYSPVKMMNNLERELSLIRTEYPDLQISLADDRTEELKAELISLCLSGLLGALAAFIVLILFLKTPRGALFTAGMIPLSGAAALIGLSLTGRSINSISLGGLTLGIGLIVDNGIVVIDQLRSGKTGATAAEAVGGSIRTGTLTTLGVFAPLFLIPGVPGRLFWDLFAALAGCLGASWILSLTLLPGLWSRRSPSNPLPRFSAPGSRPLREFIRRAAAHPAVLALLVGIPALGISGFLLTGIHRGPGSSPTAVRYDIICDLPPGTAREELARSAAILWNRLQKRFQPEALWLRAGAETEDRETLADPHYRASRITGSMKLHTPSDLSLRNSEPSLRIHKSRTPLERLLKRETDTVTYDFFGTTPEEARLSAEAALDELKAAHPELSGSLHPNEFLETYTLIPRPETMAHSGLFPGKIGSEMAKALMGAPGGLWTENDREIPVVFRISPESRSEIRRFLRYPLETPDQSSLPASRVFSLQKGPQPAKYLRKGGRDLVSLRFRTLSPKNRLLLKKFAEARNWKSRNDGEIREVKKDFSLAIGLGGLLLYFLLAAHLENFLLPILLLSSLPWGLSAALLGLSIGKVPLDLTGGIGILILFGLSVNAGLLLLEGIQAAPAPLSPEEKIFRGVTSRLRPVCLTTATTIAAVLPLALNLFGMSSQTGLYWILIGGLSGTTLWTMTGLPALLLRYSRRHPL